MPCKVSTNKYWRSLQYKILNNDLYLNKKLVAFRLPKHHFALSSIVLTKISKIFSVAVQKYNVFGKKLHLKLISNVTLLPLTLQVAFFDFQEVDYQSYILRNQILLSFILHIYKPRKGKFLIDICLLKQINKVRRMNKWVAGFPLCENKRIWFYVKFSFHFHFSPFWGNFFMVLPVSIFRSW